MPRRRAALASSAARGLRLHGGARGPNAPLVLHFSPDDAGDRWMTEWPNNNDVVLVVHTIVPPSIFIYDGRNRVARGFSRHV
jgi:hypothetical protein